MNTIKCYRCDKLVEESELSSCSVGHVEVSELLPYIEKERLNKLCSFDDSFFCNDCMCNGVCCDCAKVLTKEEIEIIKNQLT